MKTRYLTLAAFFAALIFISIYFFSVPNGFGGVIHFGDALIFIAAALLPLPYAMAAAAIGAGLFNLARVPIWFPFTIVIKPILTLCFNSKGERILDGKRNMIAPFIAAVLNTVLYFGANWLLFDRYAAVGAFVPLLIQGAGSVVFYFVIAFALDKVGIKRLLKKK